EVVRSRASPGVVVAAGRGGIAAPGRTALPGVGRVAGVAPASAQGSDGGMRQAWSGQAAAHGSVPGSAAGSAADRTGANPASFPHQTPVLGLLRPGAGDAQQRRLWFPKLTTGAPPEAGV